MQKKTNLKLTKREQDLRTVHEYKRVHDTTEIDPDKLTVWAIESGRKEPEQTVFYKKAKQELITAMRSESRIDEQGREVGVMIAIRKPQQKSLWLDLYEAKPKKCTSPCRSNGDQCPRGYENTTTLSTHTMTTISSARRYPRLTTISIGT